MKFGIGLPNQVRHLDAARLPDWAGRAEAAGFASLGAVGRFAYPGIADTVALAAAAGATRSIELISNVMLAPTWPAALLAKELAGIDAVSGHRLTVGLGIGARADDFTVDGLPIAGRGPRFDRDLEIYHDIWTGKPYGDSVNPAVPNGTRPVPMLFGGFAPAAFARMARWGVGYVGGSQRPAQVATAFDGARAAWREHGREGAPRLVAIAYFSVAHGEAGRANVHEFYRFLGEDLAARFAEIVLVGPEEIRAAVRAFDEIGADDLLFNPTVDDPAEIERLAEILA